MMHLESPKPKGLCKMQISSDAQSLQRGSLDRNLPAAARSAETTSLLIQEQRVGGLPRHVLFLTRVVTSCHLERGTTFALLTTERRRKRDWKAGCDWASLSASEE